MNDQTKPDQKLAAELLVCDCEGTMKIDADGIASGLGCAGSATAFTQLCRRELGAFKDRLGADQPMIVACTQEAPLFSEIASEAEHRTAPLSFVNIRESAGWSTDTPSKTAKMAALIAAAAVEVTPTAVMSIKSEGQCLIYGAGQTALDAAERLASRLSVTVVLTDAGDAIPPAVVDVPLHAGRIRSARGTLGNFAVEFEAFAPAQPSSRDTLAFERPRDGFKSTCDIILDLSGRPPLFNDTVKRDGYIRVDPDNPIAIAHAHFETADLFGEFEKPLYVSYDETICAHARNTRIGCRNCLDNCPTGALASNGDIIAVDAAVCGGCGNCSAVCPTGAISYDYPKRNDTIRRVQVLAETYQRAGGKKPVLLLHDEEHGRPLINMIARYGRGLPANHLPLSVYSVFQTGHDLLAAAFAAGFAHIAVLAPPDKPHDLPALETQAALIEAFVAALGIGPGRISILTECDPDIVEENLYALSPADIVEARLRRRRRQARDRPRRALRTQCGGPSPAGSGRPAGRRPLRPPCRRHRELHAVPILRRRLPAGRADRGCGPPAPSFHRAGLRSVRPVRDDVSGKSHPPRTSLRFHEGRSRADGDQRRRALQLHFLRQALRHQEFHRAHRRETRRSPLDVPGQGPDRPHPHV